MPWNSLTLADIIGLKGRQVDMRCCWNDEGGIKDDSWRRGSPGERARYLVVNAGTNIRISRSSRRETRDIAVFVRKRSPGLFWRTRAPSGIGAIRAMRQTLRAFPS